jgi:hypothetical protein
MKVLPVLLLLLIAVLSTYAKINIQGDDAKPKNRGKGFRKYMKNAPAETPEVLPPPIADSTTESPENAAAPVTEMKTSLNYVAKNGDNLPYPGMDVLGMGYSLVQGNPHGDPNTQIDPGFRSPVVMLEWDQNYVTRDVRDLQPVGGYAYPQHTCYMNKKATETDSVESYESSLEVEASVSGGGGFGPVSGSFSASAGMSSFQSEVLSTNSKRYTITSYCLSYKVGLVTTFNKKFSATPELKAAIDYAVAKSATPVKCLNADKPEHCGWFKVFDEFGSHFIDMADLGGKLLYEQTITESGVESLREQGVSVSASVEASFTGGSAAGSTNVDSSSKSSNSNSNSDTETVIKVFGGVPPESGAATEEGFSEWADTVKEFPMPVRYTLTSILKLSDFDEIRDEAMQALSAWNLAVMGPKYVKPQFTSDNLTPKKKPDKYYLKAGQVLKSGERLRSKDGSMTADLQDDGNFIIRNEGTMLYATDIYPGDGRGPYEMVVQGDGNLVIYEKVGGAIWATGTNGCGFIVNKLVLQNDGNLVLYAADGQVMWYSNTYGPKKAPHGFGIRHCNR